MGMKIHALQKLVTTVCRPAYFVEPTQLLLRPGHMSIVRFSRYVITIRKRPGEISKILTFNPNLKKQVILHEL